MRTPSALRKHGIYNGSVGPVPDGFTTATKNTALESKAATVSQGFDRGKSAGDVTGHEI